MPITLKHIRWLLCAVLVSLLLALPTARAANPHDKNDDELVIGMSFQTLDNVYFVTLQRALQEAIDDMGARFIFTDARRDTARQHRDVEDMLARDIDILLIDPANPAAIEETIVSTHEAGVTVVAVDTPARGPIDGFVGSNNVGAGYQACRYLGEQLDGRGQVAILEGAAVAPMRQRVEGCQKALAEFQGIELVDRQNGNQARNKALSVTEQMLETHPELAGIFSVDDTGVLGALVAIQTAGRNVKLAGVDGSPEAVRMLTRPNSPLIAMMAQHPADIAARALALAVKQYRGEKAPETVPVDTTLVTADNARNFLW
ncbi:monosaccharide ABC transporter substrate-binding protein, CUT2 family [Kushneria avicenniae]|uniref:Monosaccharide ABC transporter substrate-binding protein, CUT2 family n=1 Tax=Kushneria avicenniae TaxID=402385 RepID=A0A1I1LCZ0_9GAMM|nr:ABC transporter substrate-binding protein [Kushneria avicenniae]SFC70889.1 monosaccharide ABC transporter substrate-binding protein, CUT2 family [Kushneria avicenniae]